MNIIKEARRKLMDQYSIQVNTIENGTLIAASRSNNSGVAQIGPRFVEEGKDVASAIAELFLEIEKKEVVNTYNQGMLSAFAGPDYD